MSANEDFIKKLKKNAVAKGAAADKAHAASSRANTKSASQQVQESYAQQRIAARQPGYLMGNSGITSQGTQNRLNGSTQSVLTQVQNEQKRKSLLDAILNSSKKTITPVSMAKTAANVANGNAVNAFQSQPENGTERVADTVSGAVKTGIASIGNAHSLATKVMTKPTTALLDAVTNHKYNIGGAVNSISDQLNAPVNRLMESGETNTATAKRGLGKAGQIGVDLGTAATQLALTAGLGAAAGGGARAIQAVQQAGQGAYEAKTSGAGEGKQALYGILQGATAYATEGISNFGALGKIFGNGAVDSKIEQASAKAISKFISSDAGRAVANRLATGAEAGLGEALEQNIQDALTPIYQKLTYDPDAKWDWDEMLYNGLVAGALGGIVGSAGKNNLYTAEKNYDAQPVLKEFMERHAAQDAFANEATEARIAAPKAEPTETQPQMQTPAQANAEGGAQLSNELGAANSGFDPYTHLQNQFGDIAPGENPSRVIDAPLKTSDNMNVSRGVRTAMEAKATPDAALDSIQNAVVDEKFSFETITDKAAETRANQTISSKGYETALRDWTADARSGKVSKDLMAQGQVLYNNAVNAGDYKTGVDILTDYVKMSRSGAQATQANRMLKKMDPQYQLYALERQSQSISDELTQKFKKSGFEGIKLNEDLVKQFSEAPDQTTRDAVMDKLKDDVAAQIPPSWKDKWDAWRYLSMLGNPRTHIRNIVGNAGFVPVREVKNVIGAGIEKATDADRTKSVLTIKDSGLVKYAANDYSAVQDQIMQNGKFDDLASDINSRKTIYKNPLMETLRKGNGAALDAEDVWFAKPAYANSLAGYYKANGITAEALSNGSVPQATIDKARAYAIKEAQKATYRDSNDFSDWISKIGKYRGENKWAKTGSAALDAILPFRRTPANILARAWEYSPGEFGNVLFSDIKKVNAGDMDASEMIDHISSGLTGTAIMGLGAYLASEGLLTGGKSDDDDEAALAEQQGYQDYALNIGGKSITLDWLVPEALPLFTGAELFKTMQQKSDGKITLAKVLTNFGNMAEPMIDMSMLQGVNDLFDSIKYSKDNNILSIAATTAANYLSQALPTLGGQIERIGEKERQTTYVDKTSGVPTAMQYMLGKAANKIPGVEYQQRPYTDMFGQHESTGNTKERVFNNLFNPAYVRDIKQDDVTDELSRLVKGKYMTGVPDLPDQKITYGGKDNNLNKGEYTKYAEKVGQLEHEYAKAMMQNKAYDEMTDNQKADYLKSMFTYAKDEAKRGYITGKGSDYESQLDTVYNAQKAGIEPDSYYAYKKYLSDISGKESGTQAQEAQAANKLDLTRRMKGELWAIQNATSDASKNPFTGTAAQTGIAPEIVIDVQTACSEYTADKDKNGKSISGTKRAKQLAYINSKNITTAQKDALYRSVGLAESTLHNAPWH